MRLLRVPSGIFNDRDRTWFLAPPFDVLMEIRVIPRPRMIQTVPRIDQSVFVGARIRPRRVNVSPRVTEDVFVE